MERLGQGYYYAVYSRGGDRVVKKRTKHAFRMRKLLQWYGKTPLQKVKIILRYPLHARNATQAIESSHKIYPWNPELFGNPRFINRFEYEQDEAIPLERYFQTHNLEENQKRFDEYLPILFFLWTQGVSDTVFNFTIDTGISLRTNKLICLDFVEFSRSKEKVIGCIEREKWVTQKSLRDMERGELRDYIIGKMKQEATLENLEKFWNSSSRNASAAVQPTQKG
jgi:hypothetical protein